MRQDTSHFEPAQTGTTPRDPIEQLAQRRASAKLGWYKHATVYVCVIGGLALIGAWQGRVWPMAPALGWGLGLAIHGLRVFVVGGGSRLRDRLVERERQALRREHPSSTGL